MKKIILEEKEESTIHIDDVSLSDAILVKKEGKEFAVILYIDKTWVCKTSSFIKVNGNLSVVASWCGIGCEFYVLD